MRLFPCDFFYPGVPGGISETMYHHLVLVCLQVCKQQNCKADFCWVCLGPWEPHGSSWYNCNRFDEDDAKRARDAQEKSRAALARYLFYCNRSVCWEIIFSTTSTSTTTASSRPPSALFILLTALPFMLVQYYYHHHHHPNHHPYAVTVTYRTAVATTTLTKTTNYNDQQLTTTPRFIFKLIP